MVGIRNILLDRDGTIIVDGHYLHDPDKIVLLGGAVEGLQLLARAGMRFFIVTNQSGIGRGYFTEEDFTACTERLDDILAQHGIVIEKTLHCPHAPDVDCACRKPRTGMWKQLVDEFGLLPEETVMIGDKSADVSLGLNAELAASILVTTCKGHDEAVKLGLSVPSGASVSERSVPVADRRNNWPHCVAADLQAAAEWIMNMSAEKSRAGADKVGA